MPQISYQDFDVVIARLDETRRKYSVTVQGSPGGDASGDFAVRELLIKTSAISLTVEHSELTVRRNASLMNGSATNGMPLSRVFPPSSDDAKKLGTLLFDTLFKTEVRDAYNRSLGAVRGHSSSEKKLRLRLNLTAAPELAILPWEYIRDPVSSHFLSQLPDTPVVRYVNSDRPVPESLSVEAPLRLLVATSSPPGLPKLDTRAELDRLRNALQHLVDKELIEIHCLENTSLSALCNKLSECDYHILHYVGHGDYDNGSGVLLFEAEQGENEAEPDKNQERTPHRVDGSTLALKLAGFGSLRLAIINACEGASASENNCYDGVAQNLLRHGNLPAVIAMQFAITDGAAIRFAAGFYKWLARQFPVEHALAMTRGEMIVSDTDVEWATPVLFMRAKDGNLFNLNEKLPPPIPLEPSPVDPYCTSIVQAFRDGQLVFFLGLEVNLYGRQECIRNWQPGDTLPSNWELATYLTNTLELGEDEGLGVAGVSQRAFVERKKRDLSRLLRRVFTDGRADPSPLHHCIKRLFSRAAKDREFVLTQDSTLRRCAVVTTTYDNLLEKAFLETGQGDGAVPDFHVLSYQTEDVWLGRFLHVRYRNGSRSEPVVIEKPNEYMGLAGDTFPLIVKMPGAVEGDNFTYAISEDSFFAFAGRSLPRLLPREVIAKLQNSCHLYLGYKISDWNLRALLYSIWENERPRLDAWALLSPTSQDDLPPWWAGGLPDETRAEKSYWRTSDVEVIEAPLDVFVRRLRQLAEPGV